MERPQGQWIGYHLHWIKQNIYIFEKTLTTQNELDEGSFEWSACITNLTIKHPHHGYDDYNTPSWKYETYKQWMS
jgi:hypothetical protein